MHVASVPSHIPESMQCRSVDPSRRKRTPQENLKLEPIKRFGGSVRLPSVGAARSSQLSTVTDHNKCLWHNNQHNLLDGCSDSLSRLDSSRLCPDSDADLATDYLCVRACVRACVRVCV